MKSISAISQGKNELDLEMNNVIQDYESKNFQLKADHDILL